jgi:phosphoserine phosphatase
MKQNFLATVVTTPNKLDATLLNQLALDLKAEKTEVIKAGQAARFYTAHKTPNTAHQVDIFWQELPKKPIKLMLCDMESTIIKNEFLDEMAAFLGIEEQVAKITARAMNGELGFEEALKERIKLVVAISRADLAVILKKMVYNTGAHQLLKAAKEQGVYTMLVSGGFTYFTEIVARELGFDEHHANTLIFENDKIAGCTQPILGKEAKLNFLNAKTKELGIDISQTITVGDGANDLPMLHAAGVGVAFYAKPIVKQQIPTQLSHTDLSSIAYLFG